jgi:hypothetical protein
MKVHRLLSFVESIFMYNSRSGLKPPLLLARYNFSFHSMISVRITFHLQNI